MRLLALLESLEGPSARLRIDPFVGWLAERGVDCERAELPRHGLARARLLARGAEFDVVWLSRRLLLPWESAWLRRRARRLVVDLDDAVWRRDHAPFRSAARRWRARALLRRADAVTAGSAALANELRELAIQAVVVPTPAPDCAASSPEAERAGPGALAVDRTVCAKTRLVWIGQPSTWRYAAPWAAAFRASALARAGARLIVVGSGLPVGESGGVEWRDWSPAEERATLREATIALAPLPDDPWTRGKCGARHLLALAAGIPVIASLVGAQAELQMELGGAVPLAAEAEATALEHAVEAALALPPGGARCVADRRAVSRLAPLVARALGLAVDLDAADRRAPSADGVAPAGRAR